MKYVLFITLCFFLSSTYAQSKRAKVPSYFGLQFRPVFPTKFIGNSFTSASQDGFETSIQQKMGLSFGATVRAGITNTISIETGINFTQRNFDLTMAVPDSNSFAEDDLRFIEYDVPVNALFYIKLSESWYMNASLGAAITYKPTDVGIFNQPGGKHYYKHTGLIRNRVGMDANANLGFEFRTEKSGFFYLGGSARVPFAPLFDLVADYTYDANLNRIVIPVDGSFLAIDFKYIFPIINNKGTQFKNGPIDQ